MNYSKSRLTAVVALMALTAGPLAAQNGVIHGPECGMVNPNNGVYGPTLPATVPAATVRTQLSGGTMASAIPGFSISAQAQANLLTLMTTSMAAFMSNPATQIALSNAVNAITTDLLIGGKGADGTSTASEATKTAVTNLAVGLLDVINPDGTVNLPKVQALIALLDTFVKTVDNPAFFTDPPASFLAIHSTLTQLATGATSSQS